MKINLENFEKNIGYKFKNIKLLETALTHTSYAYENNVQSYERLEFLGDSILEFVTSQWLYINYKHLTEGEMTKVRATAVCEDSLFEIAKAHNFGDFLFLGKSEKSSNNIRKAILADCVEAVIAAIYLDSGLEPAEKFIISNLKDTIEIASHHAGDKDYKTVLQEKLQVHGDIKIEYVIVKEEGPDHDKKFTARVDVNGKTVAYGEGKSKQKAEMDAARIAIEKILADK